MYYVRTLRRLICSGNMRTVQAQGLWPAAEKYTAEKRI